MIKVEFYKIRNDGVILYRTYSDLNVKIERDGVLYDEAIDPADSNRIYIETNKLIAFEEMEEDINV